MGQIRINNRLVNFNDDKAKLGVKHILTMEYGERESLFRAAKAESLAGRAFLFEDREGRNFTLRRLQSGVYQVETRGPDTGWF